MDGFARRKEQKKESIRRAALELFQAYGFKKVSIHDIAGKAGVSPVTIYNHFGSKEALTLDVLKWYTLDLVDKYHGMITGDRPFIDRLEDVVFDKAKLVGQFQGELLQTYMQDSPEMQAFIQDMYENRVMPVMKEFFAEGIRQGYVDAGFSLEAIMYYFEIIRRGFFNMPDIGERTERNPALMQELIRLMTYGLNG